MGALCPHCSADLEVERRECPHCGRSVARKEHTVAMSPAEAPAHRAARVVVGTAADASATARTEPADRLTAATDAARGRATRGATVPAHPAPAATVPAHPAPAATVPAHPAPAATVPGQPAVTAAEVARPVAAVTVPARPASLVTTAARKKADAMTAVAGAGLSMAETFNQAFGSPLPGWQAELAEPAGPSTGGGKQPAQPITVVTPRGDRLAIGRVERVHRFVKLRTFDFVATMHRQRFGRPLPLSESDYREFIDRLSVMFTSAGLTIEHEDAGQSLDRPGMSAWTWIVLVVLALVGIALLIYVLALAPG